MTETAYRVVTPVNLDELLADFDAQDVIHYDGLDLMQALMIHEFHPGSIVEQWTRWTNHEKEDECVLFGAQ